MRQRFISEKSYPFCLAVLFFFIGLIAGTIWVNRMRAALFGSSLVSGLIGLVRAAEKPGAETILFVCCKRAMAAVIFWLVGMSPLAIPGVCAIAFGLGFSMAFLLSSMTIHAGIGGILLFLAAVFPQCLFYLPVGGVLTFWALSGEKGRQSVHLTGFLILLIATFIGAILEVCVTPKILHCAAFRLLF